MITRGLREYMARDWNAVRLSKNTYWGERIARLGALEGWRVAEELRQQALRCDPSWPDASQRRDDLQCHAHVAELFRRAGSARCR